MTDGGSKEIKRIINKELVKINKPIIDGPFCENHKIYGALTSDLKKAGENISKAIHTHFLSLLGEDKLNPEGLDRPIDYGYNKRGLEIRKRLNKGENNDRRTKKSN